jgi:hypothetical protein
MTRYTRQSLQEGRDSDAAFAVVLHRCIPFADDEVVRLRLSVRDWFQLQA